MYPNNLEEKAISLIGVRLYEAFIKGYTKKQWQADPRSLPSDIITRLTVRFNYNDFYFSDLFEGMPLDGYAKIFERMLHHQLIEVVTRCDFFDVRSAIPESATVVYTGPIDRYFNYRYGRLGWRTLDFETARHAMPDYQGTAVTNYADTDVGFTRIHEFRHLHPERSYDSARIITMAEYSRYAQSSDEPYYPINTKNDKLIYDEYRKLADSEMNVIFGGRLGSYRYLDMHQAIGAALKVFEKQICPMFRRV